MNAKRNGDLIQDGYLVVGTITQRGCVSYTHKNRDETVVDDRMDAEWETKKVVYSVEENKNLFTTRAALNRKIESLGASLAGYGVIVPITQGRELDDVLREVYTGIDEYNRNAVYTRLEGGFVVFTIKGGDERIAAALYNRAVSLLEEVAEFIDKGDVKGLRNALTKMTNLDKVLDKRTGEKLSKMIEGARKAARAAVKAVKKSTDVESKKKEAMAGILSETLDIRGIRASFIEVQEEVNSRVMDQNLVPDIVEVRQIEMEV